MTSAANPLPTSALLRNIELDASRGDVIHQLREALFTHAVRVIDLFKEWDKDWSADKPPITHQNQRCCTP